jgi:signal transduction histidine kinase
MNGIRSLDLLNLPDSFRNKLDEYSTNVQEFIKYFRKTIERYEKAMGESSRHGFIRSAPRKVQWAPMAADDLVKIIIQTSIL